MCARLYSIEALRERRMNASRAAVAHVPSGAEQACLRQTRTPHSALSTRAPDVLRGLCIIPWDLPRVIKGWGSKRTCKAAQNVRSRPSQGPNVRDALGRHARALLHCITAHWLKRQARRTRSHVQHCIMTQDVRNQGK